MKATTKAAEDTSKISADNWKDRLEVMEADRLGTRKWALQPQKHSPGSGSITCPPRAQVRFPGPWNTTPQIEWVTTTTVSAPHYFVDEEFQEGWLCGLPVIQEASAEQSVRIHPQNGFPTRRFAALHLRGGFPSAPGHGWPSRAPGHVGFARTGAVGLGVLTCGLPCKGQNAGRQARPALSGTGRASFPLGFLLLLGFCLFLFLVKLVARPAQIQGGDGVLFLTRQWQGHTGGVSRPGRYCCGVFGKISFSTTSDLNL